MHTSSGAVTCYPQPGKRKALDVCEAFAAGVRACGGRAAVTREIPDRLAPGDAVFYGVRPAWKHLWDQAVAEGRTRWYIDNGYFQRPPADRADSGYFRVCRNAVQAAQCPPDKERLHALALAAPAEWRFGDRVVVALQSDEFMATWAPDCDVEAFARAAFPSFGELVVRRKGCFRPLADDLDRASLLVTWSSNAAVEAVMAGVLVRVLGESVAKPYCSSLGPVERPHRLHWAAALAASQWTADELAAGKAWFALAMPGLPLVGSAHA